MNNRKPVIEKLIPNSRGITLIELVVVVAIVGVLVSIAVPAYQSYLRKSHRAEAKAALMENAQYMERYFTTHNTYYDAGDLPILPVPTTKTYTLSLVATADDPTTLADESVAIADGDLIFALEAQPNGGQADDPCGLLTVDQLGNREAAQTSCW